MKSLVLAVLIILGLATNAVAQDAQPQRHTTVSSNARFEVLAAVGFDRPTLRLDRWSGRVASLVALNRDQPPIWEDCEIVDLASVGDGRPRFQLFRSDTHGGSTFLIDGDTGRSWVMTYVDEQTVPRTYKLVWKPFTEKPK